MTTPTSIGGSGDGVTKVGAGLSGTRTGPTFGAIASIAWWQSFYSQVNGRAPIECLYQLTGSCRIVSSVAEFFGAMAYDARLLWASGIVGIFGLLLQR